MKKLAIFDIDGTIAVGGVMPESVVEGLKHLREIGYITTVSTGRGYIRAKEALGEHFKDVIAHDSFMIVEHGTKIVDREGNIIKADYFKESELDHIIDFIRANSHISRLVWFNPAEAGKRVQVWCQEEADMPEEIKKRGHYAEIFRSSYEELRKRLSAWPVSNVSVRLKDYVVVENLKLHFTRSEIDVIFQDKLIEFVRNIADKSKAVTYLCEHHQIPIEDTLIAGNAINDVDMLNLPSDLSILVGEGEDNKNVFKYLNSPERVVQVTSPEELGRYLQTL